MMRDQAVLKKDGWHHFLDGKEVTEAEFLKRYPAPVRSSGASAGNRPWSRPQYSEALAVHPSQIQEALARNARRGLHVNYDEYGRPELHDREQRKRLCEIERVFDKDGGYGDAQRTNSGQDDFVPDDIPLSQGFTQPDGRVVRLG